MQSDWIENASEQKAPATHKPGTSTPLNNCEIERATINGFPCVRTRYGVYLKTRWTDATFHFCVFGKYGNVLSDMLDNMQAEFTFIDIGANQGLYSLIAARNPACRKVYAFEPVVRTFQYLLDNLQINQTHKVVPVNAAVSDTEGTAQMATQRGHSGAATLRSCDPLLISTSDTISTIGTQRLTSLLSEADNCIIKIDVEGFEATVIEQLAQAGILERTQTLFYEVNEKWTNSAKIERHLRSLGFKGFERSGSDMHYDVMASRS